MNDTNNTNNPSNPYQPPRDPTVFAPPPIGGAGMQPGMPPAKRSAIPMVIGIISIIFAVWGLLSLVMILAASTIEGAPDIMGDTDMFGEHYFMVTTVATAVTTVLILLAGIQLVRYKKSGRAWFTAYAIATIFLTVLSTVIAFIAFEGQAVEQEQRIIMMGALIGGLIFSLIFPIVGLILLNLRNAKASLK